MIKNYLPYYPFFRTWMRKYPTLGDVLLKLGMPTAVSLHAHHGNRTFAWSYRVRYRGEVRRRAFCLQVFASGGVGKCYEFYQVSLIMTPESNGFKEVGRARYEGVGAWMKTIDRTLGGRYHKVAPSDEVLKVLNP